ncbi:MAG: hypothetical protein A3H31_08520 [Gallionellales bacterium RIFCSPLOWO2_02_FULL_57_47]|nr:MAG: hypothetical protein A3H31_08520 [Gallionellales bacterium RIFCSPLOWO2_02_FULL_57_47]OGT13062.1 MAG: hypothetical protein A3J49_08110 [Gallionellales bacterium RIFCSPHIGHO2_02_FULL_57_16]
MGHELVPLETHADAEEFLREHKGRQILTFEQFTADIIDEIDKGKFQEAMAFIAEEFEADARS